MADDLLFADEADALLQQMDERNARAGALTVAQEDAAKVNPDAAAQALKQSRVSGLPAQTFIDQPTPPKPEKWGDHADLQTLAQSLLDPDFGRVAQGDTKKLSTLERLIRDGKAFSQEVLHQADKRVTASVRGYEQGARNAQLSDIGWRQTMDVLAGKPVNPEDEKAAKAIEEQNAIEGGVNAQYELPGVGGAVAKYGPGFGPAFNEQVSQMAGNVYYAYKNKLGEMGKPPTPPPTDPAGALKHALGAEVNALTGGVGELFPPVALALQGGRMEGGLFYREALSKGVPQRTAAELARVVAVVNGSLEFLPIANVLSKIPGIGKVAGGVVRDGFRKMITSPSRLASINRFVARVAGQFITEGSTEYLQEWTGIIAEAVGLGKPVDWSAGQKQAAEAGWAGGGVGISMGIFGNVHSLHMDLTEAQRSKENVQWAADLAKEMSESQTLKRDPETVQTFAEQVELDRGEKARTFSLPAEAVRRLAQGDNLTDADLRKKMPETMRQVEAAEAAGDPTREVNIPSPEFVAHVAPSAQFDAVSEDLRVGDGMTLKEVALVEEVKPEEASSDYTPTQRVFEDVFEKAVEGGKRTPDEARTVAALIATRAEIGAKKGLAPDAWAYYQKHAIRDIKFTRDETLPSGALAQSTKVEDLLVAEVGKMSDEQISDAYWRDPITELPNARSLERLPVTAENKTLGVIDVESFKPANDVRGHIGGDTLLRLVVQTLRKAGAQNITKVGNNITFSGPDTATLSPIYKAFAAEWKNVAPGIQTAMLTVERDGQTPLAELVKAAEAKSDRRTRQDEGTFAKRGFLPASMVEKQGKKSIWREKEDPYNKTKQIPDPTPEQLAVFEQAMKDAEAKVEPNVRNALDPRLLDLEKQIPLEQRIREVFFDGDTGALNETGWNLLREKAKAEFVGSVDLIGLRDTDEKFGRLPTDNFVQRVAFELVRSARWLGIEVAHLHGDEYAFQGNNETHLKLFVEAAREMMATTVFANVRADGKVVVQNGVYFGVGIAKDWATADGPALKENKAYEKERAAGTKPRIFDSEDAARAVHPGGWQLVGPEQSRFSEEVGRQVLEGRFDQDGGKGLPGLPVGPAEPGGGPGVREGAEGPDRVLGQPRKGGIRGFIEIGKFREWFRITFTGKANLSTFIHETGHAFVEMLQADAAKGHGQSQADVLVLREWLGATDGKELSEEHLEKLARGFEAYIWEGKAPALHLESVFARMMEWMRLVYARITMLGVNLTPEVRGVFDRMLATEEEVRQQRDFLHLTNAFPGDERIRKMHDAATQEVEARVKADALNIYRRAVRDDEARVRAEVTAEENQKPARNAWLELAGKDRLDGQPKNEYLAGRKLDRAALREMGLPADAMRKLRAVSMDSEKLLDVVQPDDAAYALGFDGADDLVINLMDLPTRASAIQEEMTRRLEEIHPGYGTSPAWLEHAALDALHGRATERVLHVELEAVGRAGGAQDKPARSVAEALRRQAKAQVEQTRVLHLSPTQFLRQEEAAGREWQRAMSEQDFQTAYAAKRKQIYSHYAWRFAQEAQDRVDSMRQNLRSYETTSVRKRVGLGGQVFLEALDALLGSVDLSETTQKAAHAKLALAEKLAQLEKDEVAVAVDPAIRDGSVIKNWKLMTVGEMQAVHDAAKSIVHAATAERMATVKGKQVAFQNLVDEVVAHIAEKAGAKYRPDPRHPPFLNTREKAAKFFSQAKHTLMKVEFIAAALDGGDIAGFVHQNVFQPVADAENAEFELTERTAVKFKELLDRIDRKQANVMVTFLGRRMRKRDVLAVALNTGNLGNLQRLLDGSKLGWTEAAVVAELDKFLTDEDVAFLNDAWDLVGSLWPEIEALQRRVVGLPPTKVEARPITLPSGRKLNGGYYPIVKDPSLSLRGLKNEEQQATLFESQFGQVFVEHGFTQGRVAKNYDPLLLDIAVIPRHLRDVAHYITHYEALRQIDKLTQNKEVAQAISDALGQEAFKQIRPWLQSVAKGSAQLDTPIDFIGKVLRHLRIGATVTMYGGKFTTAIAQATGILATAERIGTKATLRGVARFLSDLGTGHPFAPAEELSGEVKRLYKNIDADMAAMFEQSLGEWSDVTKWHGQVMRASLSFMGLVQRTVSTATWWGAYEQALEQGHQDPVAYADSVMRTTQSSAGIKDLAAIQRGNEYQRLFVVGYSYFSALFGRMGMPAKSWPEMMGRAMWLVTLPVLADLMLRGKTPPKGKEEPEDWLKFFTIQQMLYASRAVPGLSLVTEQLLDPKREIRTNPWLSGLLTGARSLNHATDDRPLTVQEKRALVEVLGQGLQLPLPAMWNLYRWADTLDAQTEPTRNLLSRTPGEFK